MVLEIIILVTNTKPVVAHFLYRYLGETETFIYHPLKRFTQVEPIVIAEKVVNLDRFYLPRIYSLSLSNNIWSNMDDWAIPVLSKRFLVKFYQWYTLTKHQAKLIHAHFGFNGLYAVLLKRLTRLPLIVTFYGLDMSYSPNLPGYTSKYKQMFRVTDRILVEGPHMQQKLVELGCPPEKISIVRIGIDLELFDFKKRTFPKAGQPIKICMCGRFVEKKGFIEGINAFAKAQRLLKQPLELDIIGDGQLRPQIEQLVTTLDLQHNVKLWGSLDYKQYINLANQAHIFMAPSQTASNGDSEGGAPTVLLEMQALGLPIISTCHADIPYVVKHEQSGFLSPEFDTEALTENLVRLVLSPERWEAMGSAGRSFVEKWHKLDVIVSTLEKIYFDLIGSKSAYYYTEQI